MFTIKAIGPGEGDWGVFHPDWFGGKTPWYTGDIFSCCRQVRNNT